MNIINLSLKKVIWLSIVLLILEAIFFVIFGSKVMKVVNYCKEQIITNRNYSMMHDEKVDVSSLPILQDDTTAWYSKYTLISHGGGGINGRTYTNSLEAWELSYNHGNRVIDADLRFTSDGVLVLRHSWGDNIEQHENMPMLKSHCVMDKNGHTQYTIQSQSMNYRTFKKTKVYKQYTAMSYDDMLDFMMSHKDLYVAADIKGENSVKGDVARTYTYMVKRARAKGVEDVLNRIIISCYDYADYEKIVSIYPFKNTTMRQHFVSPNNYYELCEFCVKHDIHTVNISQCFINDPGVKILKDHGIKIYLAVVDYMSDAEYYKSKGVDGFITNYLNEDMLIENGYGKRK